jgi:hypothetical protein
MTPEIQLLGTYLRAKIDEILAAVAALTDEELNTVPDIPSANSCYVIATHVFGNMRASVLGIACGVPVHRVRSEEFEASGTIVALADSGRRLSGEIAGALAALDPSALDERLVPSQELWGDGIPHEQSRREALLHPLEHAGVHLGQIMLTVDLLTAKRDRR